MEFALDKKTNTYHRKDCDCVTDDMIDIDKNISTLYHNGYKACKKCSPLLKEYEKDKAILRSYALEHGLRVSVRGEVIYIDSFLSSWKIVHNQSKVGTCPLLLYHENTQSYYMMKKSKGNIMKTYHRQNNRYKTLLEYYQYIVQHDNYKDRINNRYRKANKKTKTDKYLYYRSKYRTLNKNVRRVENLIEELEVKGGK